jgi:hypothetical protein
VAAEVAQVPSEVKAVTTSPAVAVTGFLRPFQAPQPTTLVAVEVADTALVRHLPVDLVGAVAVILETPPLVGME